MAPRKKTKKRPSRVVLRGTKETLSHLRVVYAIRWSRWTLWRKRLRPRDPFPGELILLERRLLFVTTDAEVADWVRQHALPARAFDV